MRREDKRKLKTTEMRMLRTLCEKTLKDIKYSNDKNCKMTGLKSVDEFLQGQSL